MHVHIIEVMGIPVIVPFPAEEVAVNYTVEKSKQAAAGSS